MSSSVIGLKNVTKLYGNTRGIKNVSLDVQEGEVFGFLGPNGAGKSTTINLMVDLIRPTSGKISILGQDSVTGSLHIRQHIGYLTDDMPLDKSLTGWQQLEYFGNLRGKFDKQHVRELAKRYSSNLDKKIKTLSRGNRQKVGLISALMHEPELLILDEPTSGLDPIVQQEFNKSILERKNEGKTTFISSHILSEVQEICDRVAFIREGKIISVEKLDDLAKGSPKQIQIISKDKALLAKVKKIKGVTQANLISGVIKFNFNGDINTFIKILSTHKLTDITINDADLESVFMRYYEDRNV